MVNIRMVTKPILKRMHELQPNTRMLYLVRSIDLAKTTRDYDIAREAIISRPIKFSSVVRALMPDTIEFASSANPERDAKGKRRPNRSLAKDHPLDILIVDDNAVNVTVGKRILEMFGYKSVSSASDGQQAIEKAEAKHYDLILLDLQMPVLDGFTAQKRIRASKRAADPCVVALTANADQKTQEQCAEAQFFDYLSKPLDIPKLEGILEAVYAYRRKHHLPVYAQSETPNEKEKSETKSVPIGTTEGGWTRQRIDKTV